MIDFINFDILEQYSKEELEKKLNKDSLAALELLTEITNDGIKLFSNELLMEHQNTNYENYQFILKDFIDEVNKSTKIIVDAIKLIYNKFPEIIVDKPMFIGHHISRKYMTDNVLRMKEVDQSIIESLTIKEHYCNYMNDMANKGLLVSNYLKEIDSKYIDQFEIYMGLKKNEDGTLIPYTFDTMFDNRFQSKREALILDQKQKLKSVLRRSSGLVNAETYEAIKYFTYSTDDERNACINELYYSVNLVDEKILEKKDQIFFYGYGNKKFEFIGNNVINAKKSGLSWTHKFSSNFDISYYIKKELIELYTKKDMFTFMCLYKDFLRNYVYLNFKDRGTYNQEHPAIIEANLIDEVRKETYKYEKRLQYYYERIEEIKKSSKDCLIITKNINDWLNLLEFPDVTKKYLLNKFNLNKEPTLDEFIVELKLFGTKTIENVKQKILNTDEKIKLFQVIQNVNIFLASSINNMYNKLYYEDQVESSNKVFDSSRLFSKRDRASFHSTLKDSVVFDVRNGNLLVSENVSKYLNEEEVGSIKTILQEHKYHDYLELDPDIFNNENSITNIDEVIFFLKKSNNFDFPVPQKCALKYRKLGNYKALGIYFSFSKQLGLDYRKGVNTYIHEMAHHIDLNTENSNRKYMVEILKKYFKFRIDKRIDYYFKSEELIARAAEISMILLLGRYYQFKEFYMRNEIDESTFVQAVKETFNKSKYKAFMDSYENYKCAEYIDIEKEIMNKNFQFIENLLSYFKAFWSGKNMNNLDEKKLCSSINVSFDNENTFSKKNEYSYSYFYRNMFKTRIIIANS